MVYVWPNQKDSKVEFRSRYQNFIGGEWTRPVKEQYFENITPVTGRPFCEIPRSTAEDIEKALDAAHAAKPAWYRTTPAFRAQVLCKIADRIEQNVERLAVAETWDCGKPVRETVSADLPLVVDYFRYYAGCLRAQEGSLCEVEPGTVAYRFNEPVGVVGQVLPWTFPLLGAASKLAPALAAGNCCILKPSEQTPASLLVLMDLIYDLLPAGVVNVVNGYGTECAKPLAGNKRIQKLSFSGDVAACKLMLQYAAECLVPVSYEPNGKVTSLYFDDVYAKNDDFVEKAVECFAMFALCQADVYGCPSRALIDTKIFSKMVERGIERTKKYVPGNPLDPATTVGAQVSSEYLEKALSCIDLGKREGAKVLLGGERVRLSGELAGGYYMTPTVLHCNPKMCIFQEEVFGPVLCATSFNTYEEAVTVTNEVPRAAGTCLWTRDTTTAYRASRSVHGGRVWANCNYLYPAYAAFGGYKQSGSCNEVLCTSYDGYQQIKNVLCSYDTRPIGFF